MVQTMAQFQESLELSEDLCVCGHTRKLHKDGTEECYGKIEGKTCMCTRFRLFKPARAITEGSYGRTGEGKKEIPKAP